MSKGNKFDWDVLKRILALAKPYKMLFILVGILAVLIAPISAIRPYLINIIVDDHIFNNDLEGLTRMSLIFMWPFCSLSCFNTFSFMQSIYLDNK